MSIAYQNELAILLNNDVDSNHSIPGNQIINQNEKVYRLCTNPFFTHITYMISKEIQVIIRLGSSSK